MLFRQCEGRRRRRTGTVQSSQLQAPVLTLETTPPVVLLDPISASQRLKIAPSLLEALAHSEMIPHYDIQGHIRFDPTELDDWVRLHRIDEILPDLEDRS